MRLTIALLLIITSIGCTKMQPKFIRDNETCVYITGLVIDKEGNLVIDENGKPQTEAVKICR